MNVFTVYIHENKSNGKKYVGITGRPVEVRWGKEGRGYHKSRYFFNAINKYGWDNFNHKIVAVNLTSEEAKQMEIRLIKKYKTINSQFGYNLMAGGQGNVPNDEVRKRMSDSQKRVWEDESYRRSMIKTRREIGEDKEFKKLVSNNSKLMWKNESSRAKVIKALKENGSTTEFKEKMSQLTTGKKNGFYGKKHTEEAKKKMSIKKLGKSLSEEHKQNVSKALKIPVVMLSKDGRFIKEFESATDAKREVNAHHVGECCRGNRKTSGGYKWMYLTEYQRVKST